MFSPGGRLFSKLRPRPAPRAGAGRASPRGPGAQCCCAVRARPRRPRICHPTPDGSSKPEGGTASIVRKVIFRRPRRRQAPAANTHPFLSSFASFAGAGFSVCRFSIASAAFPASAQEPFTILLSLVLFNSLFTSLHTGHSAQVPQRRRAEARFAGAPAASNSRGKAPVT